MPYVLHRMKQNKFSGILRAEEFISIICYY